jgi:DNA (cytosine-5)-methyltransferase 1
MIRFGSVCSGVGGLDHKFIENKNFKCVFLSEIDRYASSVLEYKYDIKNIGDFTKIQPETLPDIDLLIGGTPCQSFSTAGGRKGLGGASGLLLNYIEILRTKKPRYFIWENVTGSLSSTKGFDLARLHLEVAKIGYQVRQKVLSGQDYGTPQARERIFIVGYLGKNEDTVKALFRCWKD